MKYFFHWLKFFCENDENPKPINAHILTWPYMNSVYKVLKKTQCFLFQNNTLTFAFAGWIVTGIQIMLTLKQMLCLWTLWPANFSWFAQTCIIKVLAICGYHLNAVQKISISSEEGKEKYLKIMKSVNMIHKAKII